MLDIRREQDPETLRRACFAYEKANGQLVERIRYLAQKLADLQGSQVAQADLELPEIHLDGEQASGSGEEESAPPADVGRPEEPERKPQRGHGPRPQPQLPIEELLHRWDRSPSCDLCGKAMDEMVGQTEDAEEITVSECTYKIILHRRQKYRCRCNGQVQTAPGPPKLIPGGRYSVEFAVHTAIAKYCDHLPLERQARQGMARAGLDVSSQTLWDQLNALGGHLEPTWQAIGERALLEPVLHVDETGWRMMGSKSNSKWTVWGLSTPELAWYQLAPSKSTATAEKILGDYRGTLVVDGFQVYPKLRRQQKGAKLQIAHCWAHVLRKFRDECRDPPERIREILSLIGKLYEIEKQIEIDGAFPGDEEACAQRLTLRQEESRAVTQEIWDWACTQGGMRRSAFGRAVRYLVKHWKGLTVFLENPRVQLDNNHAERALRGIVVGRKNFYGTRSRRGAKVASILYSLIGTAHLQGVEPSEYLTRAAIAAIRKPGTVTWPS